MNSENKTVVMVKVPVTNYYKDGIYEQELFFSKSPTLQDFVEIVSALHNRDSQFDDYDGHWKEIIDLVNENFVKPKEEKHLVDYPIWQFVGQNVIMKNTFVKTAKFGHHSMTWYLKQVF